MIKIAMVGIAAELQPLNRGMWTVAKGALAAGIRPAALRFHEGLSTADNRWTQVLSNEMPGQALERLGRDPKRWFCETADVLAAGAELWILTNQWSWDELYGSCRTDLERIRSAFPRLNLSWRYHP